MITIALASLLGGGLGALEWRRVARRHPSTTPENALRHARHVLAIIPLTLALLAVQVLVVVHPDITWNAPVWLELHYTSLVLGSVAACMSFVFGLAAHGAFAARQRNRAPLLLSALAVVGVVAAIERDFTDPIGAELRERMNGDVVLQSTGASCAAASAANLARRYGLAKTEAEMATLLGTTRFGSTPAQVVHGLEGIGLACRKASHASFDAASIPVPAVLFYPPSNLHGAGHVVVLEGFDGENAVILDPLVGRLPVNPAELRERWKGHAVECDPPPRAAASLTHAEATRPERRVPSNRGSRDICLLESGADEMIEGYR